MMILRHLASILVLPVTVTVVVPYLLLADEPAPLASWPGSEPLRVAATVLGLGVLAGGLGLVGLTIGQFATAGRGTLAPWDPPKHLVVAGVYRHVRNPMISGVMLVLLGEALVFGSPEVLAWAAVFFLINAAYIPLVEERGLVRRFGADYRDYRRHVPRWIPQVNAWEPPWQQPGKTG